MPEFIKPSVIISDIPEILKGLPVTLEIAFISMLFSLILGFAVAIIKIRRIPLLLQISEFYVSFMRGTPILLQLYLSYYGIPVLLQYYNYFNGTNVQISTSANIVFVLIAFALNEGAYASENIRAALESVDKGQKEAALSIGLSEMQSFWKIILPEAMIVALPSLGNQFIGLIKSTSLAFVCAVIDMTAAGQLVASRTLRFFEMYIALSFIYWIITLFLSWFFRAMEQYLKKNERVRKAI